MTTERLRKAVREYANEHNPGWYAVYIGFTLPDGQEEGLLILPESREAPRVVEPRKPMLRIHGVI